MLGLGRMTIISAFRRLSSKNSKFKTSLHYTATVLKVTGILVKKIALRRFLLNMNGITSSFL